MNGWQVNTLLYLIEKELIEFFSDIENNCVVKPFAKSLRGTIDLFDWNRNPGKCGGCKKAVSCKSKHHLHLAKRHGRCSSFALYEADSIEEVLHQCHICKGNIYCDKKTVQGHLLSTHKMKLKTYEETYKDQLAIELGWIAETHESINKATFAS